MLRLLVYGIGGLTIVILFKGMIRSGLGYYRIRKAIKSDAGGREVISGRVLKQLDQQLVAPFAEERDVVFSRTDFAEQAQSKPGYITKAGELRTYPFTVKTEDGQIVTVDATAYTYDGESVEMDSFPISETNLAEEYFGTTDKFSEELTAFHSISADEIITNESDYESDRISAGDVIQVQERYIKPGDEITVFGERIGDKVSVSKLGDGISDTGRFALKRSLRNRFAKTAGTIIATLGLIVFLSV